MLEEQKGWGQNVDEVRESGRVEQIVQASLSHCKDLGFTQDKCIMCKYVELSWALK